MNVDTKYLIQELVTWEKHKMELYVEDILNMMIHLSMATETEVKEIRKEIKAKETTVKLPTKYL